MLYAQVIVKKRTNVEELTYAVPAEIVPYIRLGSLVTVPLRRKKVGAVVVDFKRTIPRNLSGKIRPIEGIDRNLPSYNPVQIAVIRQLAADTGASVAEIAFHALRRPGRTSPVKAPSTPIFIQGDWPHRLEGYLKLLQRLKSGRSALCLFAQRPFANEFLQILKTKKLSGSIIALDGTKKIEKVVIELEEKKASFIAVGTLGDLFWPLRSSDLLLIDQPDHLGSVSQQRPFLSMKRVGLVRANLEGLSLVFGSELVAVTDLETIRQKKWRFLALPFSKSQWLIIDNRGNEEVIHSSILTQIQQKSVTGQRLLVVNLARGWASALVCSGCGTVNQCHNCQRTIGLDSGGQLLCHYCAHHQTRPSQCSVCGAQSFVNIGSGVTQLVTQLQRLLPKVKIKELSGDRPHLDQTSQIIVATEKIFNSPAHFDAIFIVDADRLLTGAVIDGAWQLLSYCIDLQARAPFIAAQTYLSDHPVWGAVTEQKVKTFLTHELELRRTLRLPPYGSQLAIVGQGSSTRLISEVKELQSAIHQTISDIDIGPLSTVYRQGSFQRVELPLLLPQLITRREKEQLRQLLPPSWHLKLP